MRKLVISAIAIALSLTSFAPAGAATKSVKGNAGQVLSASTGAIKSGNAVTVTVTGNHFDETVGIYLAFCVLPKTGGLPTPCGGGINKAGESNASFWISSNPPPYGIGLAREFLPGGRFKMKLLISKMIGKSDCTKVKCAITVRADHLRNEDRSYDLFIPITVK